MLLWSVWGPQTARLCGGRGMGLNSKYKKESVNFLPRSRWGPVDGQLLRGNVRDKGASGQTFSCWRQARWPDNLWGRWGWERWSDIEGWRILAASGWCKHTWKCECQGLFAERIQRSWTRVWSRKRQSVITHYSQCFHVLTRYENHCNWK